MYFILFCQHNSSKTVEHNFMQCWHFPFRIVRKLNQDDPEFWNKVMNYVRTKTIEECQEHFYTAMSSRKRPSKPPNSAKGLYLMFRLINFCNIKPYPSVKHLINYYTLKVWLCSELLINYLTWLCSYVGIDSNTAKVVIYTW